MRRLKVADDWRLINALTALHSGIRSLREEDEELGLDALLELPDERAAVEDALVGVARAAKRAERLADIANEEVADLQARAKRFQNRYERLRGLALAAMESLGETTIERAQATISVRPGRQAVIVTDETALPDEYFDVKRTLSKTRLAEDLKAGVILDGATLSNGMNVITLKVK